MKRTKQQARTSVQSRLDALTGEEFQKKAHAAREHARVVLSRLHTDGRLRTVLSYHANPKWREVDVLPLEGEFASVRFGYVALSAHASLPDVPYDAVLVPLYGFNDDGYRLGHGSGWYDRFLAAQPQAYKIGVGLEANRIDFTPEPHDIAMDYIITERDMFEVSPQ